MLSNLSTLTNDPLSLWEWTVPDEGYCTGSTAPGESQFTNMKRKSRKNGNVSKNITTALGGSLFYIFTKRFLKNVATAQLHLIFRFPIAPEIPVT